MEKKETVEQISVKFKKSDYESLRLLSSKTHKPMAEIIRDYVDKGMHIEKTKDDIDFIRKNIREEIDIAMDGYMNRIIKLLVKSEMYVIPQCLFSAQIIHSFIKLKQGEDITLDEFWETSKKGAVKIIGDRNKDFSFDKIYEDYYKGFYGQKEKNNSL